MINLQNLYANENIEIYSQNLKISIKPRPEMKNGKI